MLWNENLILKCLHFVRSFYQVDFRTNKNSDRSVEKMALDISNLTLNLLNFGVKWVYETRTWMTNIIPSVLMSQLNDLWYFVELIQLIKSKCAARNRLITRLHMNELVRIRTKTVLNVNIIENQSFSGVFHNYHGICI